MIIGGNFVFLNEEDFWKRRGAFLSGVDAAATVVVAAEADYNSFCYAQHEYSGN